MWRAQIASFLVKLIKKLFGAEHELHQEMDFAELKKDMEMDDHKITIAELCLKLHVSDAEKGHTGPKAAELLAANGPNALSPPQTTPEWVKLVKNMTNGFGLLLWAGSLLSLTAYVVDLRSTDEAAVDNLYMAVVLAVVVLVTGGFQYYQESNASAVMESFKNMVPQFSMVIRDGQKLHVKAETLVLGDVVEIKGGDRIPADVRIIRSQGFKVDNSSLTGESDPLLRTPDYTNDNPLETRNLAFFSTSAVEGTARAMVVRCGDHTVMGRIAHLAAGLDVGKTPLTHEVELLIKIISGIALSLGLIFGIMVGMTGYTVVQSFIFLIGVIVGNVPEGLMATMTVSLTLTAKRMASKNCLVKNLQAVETLGSTSTICSDKTGTLTQNRMTVAHFWLNRKIYETNTSEHQCDRQTYEQDHVGFTHLARCAAVCNRAEFKPGEEDVPAKKRITIGDASESALLKFCEVAVRNVDDWREQMPKVCEIPFNSTNKFQVSIHSNDERRKPPYILLIKGAPERIADKCSTIQIDGESVEFDESLRAQYNEAYLALGSMGERVLGFAQLELPASSFPLNTKFNADDPNFPLEDLEFLGLMSMIDPPRAAVPDAVAKCRAAGIKVVMVTGDHPITAQAIAKSVGIISPDSETLDEIAERRKLPKSLLNPRDAKAAVIHGGDLKELSEAQLLDILRDHSEIVFARTSPQQKLQIVEAFQQLGNIVAVTGDGVNDSPALKQADIGVAMGISGSDVSKQTADMILLDDNFATIVVGVEEGRLIFENLKKCIAYSLTSQIPEFTSVIFFVVCGVPLPLGTFEMLAIDVLTDTWPAIALAYEHGELDIMKRKPRNPKGSGENRLINMRLIHLIYYQEGLMEALAAILTYFVIMGENGFKPQTLIGLRKRWDSKAINNLPDSYGQEWTYANRKMLEYTCQTAFFSAIVIAQLSGVLIRKSLRGSAVSQGMHNWPMNFGLIFEVCVAAFLTYCPGLQDGLHLYPMRWNWWIPSALFALLLFVYDETRRYYIRKHPGGLIERETMF